MKDIHDQIAAGAKDRGEADQDRRDIAQRIAKGIPITAWSERLCRRLIRDRVSEQGAAAIVVAALADGPRAVIPAQADRGRTIASTLAAALAGRRVTREGAREWVLSLPPAGAATPASLERVLVHEGSGRAAWLRVLTWDEAQERLRAAGLTPDDPAALVASAECRDPLIAEAAEFEPLIAKVRRRRRELQWDVFQDVPKPVAWKSDIGLLEQWLIRARAAVPAAVKALADIDRARPPLEAELRTLVDRLLALFPDEDIELHYALAASEALDRWRHDRPPLTDLERLRAKVAAEQLAVMFGSTDPARQRDDWTLPCDDDATCFAPARGHTAERLEAAVGSERTVWGSRVWDVSRDRFGFAPFALFPTRARARARENPHLFEVRPRRGLAPDRTCASAVAVVGRVD